MRGRHGSQGHHPQPHLAHMPTRDTPQGPPLMHLGTPFSDSSGHGPGSFHPPGAREEKLGGEGLWIRRQPKRGLDPSACSHPVGVQEQVLHGLSQGEELQLLDDVHPGSHDHRLVQPAVTWSEHSTQALGGARCPHPHSQGPGTGILACCSHSPVPRKRTS